MVSYTNDSVSLSVVPILSLRAYLASQGWRSIEEFGGSGYVYGLDGSPEELLVPMAPLADYPRRVTDILETLSKVEHRDDRAILRDLSLAYFDLVRVLVPEDSVDGSVSVSSGVTAFQESRNLLLAAACSASRSQRVFRAGSHQEASDYMNSVRFGQTEMGSFVVTLLSPVPPRLEGQIHLETGVPTEPFPRRAVHKLVSGLRSVSEAVASVNSGGDIDAFEQRVSEGVSANLCDAVANLLDCANRQSVNISVSWSLIRAPSEGRAQVDFLGSDSLILKEASRILKDRQERPNERLDGYVYSLTRGMVQERGRAILKVVIDGVISSVRADFAPEDYNLATEAHSRRQVVSLEGDLRRDGQRWVLGNPRALVVQSEEEEEEEFREGELESPSV